MYKLLIILLDTKSNFAHGIEMKIVEFDNTRAVELAFQQLNNNPMIDVTKLY